MKNFSYVYSLVFIILWNGLIGQTIHVPQDYPTIQSGIDHAQTGDTVLVDEGTYYENINFKGKSIIVTSKYVLENNTQHILTTIINGGSYSNIDSASCVMFVSAEGPNSVIQGFTLTGGKGTFYNLDDLNEPQYAGYTTHEGGGVFVNESSPTIKNNLIIDNEASSGADYDYNGGGGISSFMGNPTILNNIIIENEAFGLHAYGPGIVFNKSNGTIRNNVVCKNKSRAGGGIFIDIGVGATIENNTVVENISSTNVASGLYIHGTNSIIRNNIIWGNLQTSGDQISGVENSIFEYNNSEQEFPNMPTIFTMEPEFVASNYYLQSSSPCIDLGNPTTIYFDIEDTSNPGFAKFPSLGSLTNDVGAYGGPYASLNPDFITSVKKNEDISINVFPNPSNKKITIVGSIINLNSTFLSLSNIMGQKIAINNKFSVSSSSIYLDVSQIPNGIYMLNITMENSNFIKKIIIQH